MALPVKTCCKTLPEARVTHEKKGGVLLVEPETFVICSCLPIKWNRCECRTPKHVSALAPTWDESHPDNVAMVYQKQEHQIELF